jgi:ABC-2 type transport system permease protein
MSQPPELGVIHDIGYRHYDGPRLGRGYLLRSLYVESLKGAFGLGRSTKSKVMPILLLVAITLPALIISLVAGLTGAKDLGLDYTQYSGFVAPLISIFAAAQCPASVSRDLRFRVLPLYLSRPLTRADYVLAKFAAMASALFILMLVPLLVLYSGALLSKLAFWTQTKGALEAVLGDILLALVIAGIGLVVASVTPRRGFGVAAIIAVLIVASIISITLMGITHDTGHLTQSGYYGAIDPYTLVDGVSVWLFNAEPTQPVGPPGNLGGAIFLFLVVVEIVGCYVLLRLRYRKVSAA